MKDKKFKKSVNEHYSDIETNNKDTCGCIENTQNTEN